MGSNAEGQAANVLPPRRGRVLVVNANTAAVSYDLRSLNLGSGTPDSGNSVRKRVFVTLRAEGATVWYHFSNAAASDLDPATNVAQGAALAFSNTYGEPLKDGATDAVRIDRTIDTHLVVRTTSGTAKLVLIPSSEEAPG